MSTDPGISNNLVNSQINLNDLHVLPYSKIQKCLTQGMEEAQEKLDKVVNQEIATCQKNNISAIFDKKTLSIYINVLKHVCRHAEFSRYEHLSWKLLDGKAELRKFHQAPVPLSNNNLKMINKANAETASALKNLIDEMVTLDQFNHTHGYDEYFKPELVNKTFQLFNTLCHYSQNDLFEPLEYAIVKLNTSILKMNRER